MPAGQRPQPANGPVSSTTMLCIVLIITLPTLFLMGICLARRLPLFAFVPGNKFHAVRQLTHPSSSSKPWSSSPAMLQRMPILRYDNKLSAAVERDIEAGYGGNQTDTDINTSFEDLAVVQTPAAAQYLAAARPLQKNISKMARILRWLPLPAAWKGGERRASAIELMSQTHSPSTRIKNLGKKQAAECCAICTDDFRIRTWVRKLPCGHIFHPKCIDPWLLDCATTCPLCRIDLRVREKTDTIAEPPRAVVAGEPEGGGQP